MTQRFHTIDGEALMNQPLEPIHFVVDGLLSHGLYLLAGAPKSGKSWLALCLSVTVAKGEAAWGNRVRQGQPCTSALRIAACVSKTAC